MSSSSGSDSEPDGNETTEPIEKKITEPIQKPRRNKRREAINMNIGISLFIVDAFLFALAGALYVMKPACIAKRTTTGEYFPGMETVELQFDDDSVPEFGHFNPPSSFSSFHTGSPFGSSSPSSYSPPPPHSPFSFWFTSYPASSSGITYNPTSSSGSPHNPNEWPFLPYTPPSSSASSSPHNPNEWPFLPYTPPSSSASSNPYDLTPSSGNQYGSIGSTTSYGTSISASVPSVSESAYVTGGRPSSPSLQFQPSPSSGSTYGTNPWHHYPVPVSPVSQLSPETTGADVSLIPEDKFNTTNFKCGVQAIKPDQTRTGRIVGGSEAIPHSWPWIARFGYSATFVANDYNCAATIVSPRHFISALHCLRDFEVRYQILVGKQSMWDSSGEMKRVVKIRNHPLSEDDTAKHYDLFLGTIEEELVFTTNVQPACLPQLDKVLEAGITCWAYGWGTTHDPNYKGELKQVDLTIGSEAECIAQWSETRGSIQPYTLDKEFVICAGTVEGQDTCQGDSGGPLTCKENGKWILYGVTSWGDICGRGLYGKYAAVSFSMPWFCCFLKDLPACAEIACDVDSLVKPVERH